MKMKKLFTILIASALLTSLGFSACSQTVTQTPSDDIYEEDIDEKNDDVDTQTPVESETDESEKEDTQTDDAEKEGDKTETQTPVTTTTGFSYVTTYCETITAEWTGGDNTVYYKLSSSNDYIEVENNLVRKTESGYRVDIVGLSQNYYDIKVGEAYATNVSVESYDRSGYAHFGFTDGIGAYTDDGTLKDGALVIYLTEENKNDVSSYCYTYSASTQTYTKVDITSYLTCSVDTNVTEYGSGAQVGIGQILNNRRYSGSDRQNVGIAKLCDTFGAVNIRVLGQVSASLVDGTSYDLVGITDYNATTNGGSSGDNGGLVRMTNAHDVTIEGIGDDATIKGWGFHFISSDVLKNYQSVGSGAGRSFEVRNLTFTEYPEDAIGMEGIQGTKYDASGSVTSGASDASAELLSPVERCWIHNNTFYSGYCANPAESDKGEGDGSCDFKRGQYFTLSYNYFDTCHKTNLIGSADTSLSYNITMHHNYWKNCASRIPLVRRANVHFYNNYVYGNITEATLSYVHSARANAYMYSEHNYYDGCKNVKDSKEGVVKGYQNVYYACYSTNTISTVDSRTDKVSNSCSFIYRGIDYSAFDTDSTLFYYDDVNKVSDCYITDAVTARSVVLQKAGANKSYGTVVDTNMSTYADKVAQVSVNDYIEKTLEISLTGVTEGSYVNGVYFTGKTSSGRVKGKGQVATFRLTESTDITIAVSGSSEVNLGELVCSDGTVYASKFTSVSTTLPAGTYFIASGSKDKEVQISSLIFTSGLTNEEKASNIIALINAIPSTITLSDDCVTAITLAYNAYENATSEVKELVTNSQTLLAAYSTYSTLAVENVITLISNIGEVTSSSADAIDNARDAYNALTTEQKALVTNYQTLVDAEASYDEIAVSVVLTAIENLPSISQMMTEDELNTAYTQYNYVLTLYLALDSDQKSEVEIDDVTSGIEQIEQALLIYEFKSLLDGLDVEALNLAGLTNVISKYNALTTEQISLLTDAEITIYNSVLSAYEIALSNTIVAIFAEGYENDGFEVYKTDGSSLGYKKGETFEYDGVTYSNPLKVESKTQIAFTTTITMTLTIKLSSDDAAIKVDGTSYKTDSDGIVTITIEAGSHIISKDSSCNIYYLILSAVA